MAGGVITCAESEERLALAAIGVLAAEDAAALDAHLHTCATCRVTGQEFQRAAALLPESLELIEPPASLRRSLLAEVYGASPARERRHWWRSLWHAIPQGRPFTLAAAGAAVAAVVLGVWGASRSMVAPQRTFAVVGTTSEPQARGMLTYDPVTTQAVITVSGLPSPVPVGHAGADVYELWLIPRDGSPRAAAYLTQSPLTHTWSAAITGDMSQYTTMAATEEPAGGSPQPTGAQLFSVQLQ